MTDEGLKTLEAVAVAGDSRDPVVPPQRSRAKSPPLPVLPRLILKSGEIFEFPEYNSGLLDLVELVNRRVLCFLDKDRNVPYDEVEVLELPDIFPFRFEERRQGLARQVIVPRAGRVMTDERVLEDFSFTWGDVTRHGGWIPRDGDITRNAVAMVRRLGEVLDGLGNPTVKVLVWYAPKSLSIFNDDHNRIYAQYGMGHGMQFSVEGMQAKEVQEALNPLWDGGMGCGKDFTYLDMRGYRARWRFLKAE